MFSLLEKFRKQKQENDRLQAESNACELYQVREYQGQIWLTFDGKLVCPTSMLNKEPVEALKVMREMYVERNTDKL